MPKVSSPPGTPCEYLGLSDDSTTCLNFPSYQNQCHRAKPAAAARLAYQRKYCLTALHSQCVVFRAVTAAPLPADIREPHLPSSRGQRAGLYLLVAFLALATALGGLWYIGALALPAVPGASVAPAVGAGAPGAASGTPVPTLTTATPSPAVAPFVPFPSPDLASVPSDVSELGVLLGTPTAMSVAATSRAGVCGHQLDEPIGLGRQFIVHRVQNGDSLELYASTYGTTQAAIEGVNAEPVLPLQPDQIIVIPLHQKAISAVPPFRASRVEQRDARVSKLAAVLGASTVDDFLFYNGYSFTQCPIFSGWVLVPRAEPRATPTLDCRASGYQAAIICYPTATPTHKERGN